MADDSGLTISDSGTGGVTENTTTVVKAGAEEANPWKQRYDQLIAQHDAVKKTQAGSDQKVSELSRELLAAKEQVTKLNEQLGMVDTEKAQTAQVLSDLNERVRQLSQENEERKRLEAEARWQAEQTQLVTSKYPALLPLLQAGALPAAKDLTELDTKLAVFNQLTSNVASQQIDQTLTGGRPPGPGPTTPNRAAGDEFKGMSRDELWKEMQAASAAKDTVRYGKLREAWYNIK
jgi:chromosome segregation ATPase